MKKYEKICRYCREEFNPSEQKKKLVKKAFHFLPRRKFYYCDNCIKHYNELGNLSRKCHSCNKIKIYTLGMEYIKINKVKKWMCQRCLDKPYRAPETKTKTKTKIKVLKFDYDDSKKYNWDWINKKYDD